MAPHFLELPPEILVEVVKLVPLSDLPNLRAVCKELERDTFDHFAVGFFTSRRHSLSKEGLRRLLDIASHNALGPYIRTIMFQHEKSDRLATLASTPELNQSLAQIASHGHRVSIGVAYGHWDFTMNERMLSPAGIPKHILFVARTSGLLLESFLFELCRHQNLDDTIRRAGGNRYQCLLMKLFRDIREVAQQPDLDWIVQFEPILPCNRGESNPAHASARFCYNQATGSLRGESFSVTQLWQINGWLHLAKMTEISFSFADVSDGRLQLIFRLNFARLRRIYFHSISLYRERSPYIARDATNWVDTLALMRELRLQHYSLEFLWGGQLACAASEIITAKEWRGVLVATKSRHRVIL